MFAEWPWSSYSFCLLFWGKLIINACANSLRTLGKEQYKNGNRICQEKIQLCLQMKALSLQTHTYTKCVECRIGTSSSWAPAMHVCQYWHGYGAIKLLLRMGKTSCWVISICPEELWSYYITKNMHSLPPIAGNRISSHGSQPFFLWLCQWRSSLSSLHLKMEILQFYYQRRLHGREGICFA